MDTIAISPQNIGETTYLPGDRIEVEDCLRAGLLNERTVDLLRRNKAMGEATPETMRMAVARRPHGSPWPPRGFTEAYLVQKGLIDTNIGAQAQPEAPAVPAKPKAEKKKPASRVATVVTSVPLTDEKIVVGINYLQPKKNGRFTLFDAVDASGKLLRHKSFRTVEAGTAFLMSLSTSEAAAGSPEAQEHADDSDVRPIPDESNRQDPPADR